ncbi:MAG: flagellar export chaperone FlgN [Lachnospiraceae bacterium]|nr:flagellar export chaperone FlgN [Lachnospiraceae bacterium]
MSANSNLENLRKSLKRYLDDPQRDKTAYLSMLETTLEKKKSVLKKLLEETEKQEKLLNADELNFDEFEKTITAKTPLISDLETLDEGFQMVYDKVSDELKYNRLANRELISKLQKLIEEIAGLGSRLQTLEQKNHDNMELLVSSKRQGIKQVKVSAKTANMYYKNMAKVNVVDSSFIDKKQ